MASSLAIQSVAPQGRPQPRVIGVLKDSDFNRLKCEGVHFPFPDQYDDWLDEREGLSVGLSAAGVRTVMITVDLDRFLTWCRKEAVPIGEDALDRFAATMCKRVDIHRTLVSGSGTTAFSYGGSPLPLQLTLLSPKMRLH